MRSWFTRKKPGGKRTKLAGSEPRAASPTLAEQFWGGNRKAVPARSFPRFRATANDRVDLLQSDVHARLRIKLLEAFTPSQPVGDRERYAGRADLLTSLIRAIEEKRLHVILYGARGLGKTSTMHVLTQAAREARYLVVYLSCGADSNFDDVFRAIAASIPMLFYSAVGLTSPEVEKGKTLADILPAEPISPRFASDLLAHIVGTRVVVLLDEFDRCESPLFRRNVAELIKNLSDRLVRVQLIIAGVAADLVELLEHSPSIQRNIYPLQVPRMTAEEVLLLIKNGQDLSGVRFSEAASAVVIKGAHGSPYLANLLSHHAGISALEGTRTEVTAMDASEGITAALREFKSRLSARAAVQLDLLVKEGHVRGLGALAGHAMTQGTSFSAQARGPATIGTEPTESYNDLLPILVANGLLLEKGVDGGKAYQFSDDNITHYLWLLMVDWQLRGTRQPETASEPRSPATKKTHAGE